MTQFEKWAEKAYAETRDIGEGWNGPLLRKCWLACAAEAERIARYGPDGIRSLDWSAKDAADAIAQLREVDR